MPSILKPRDPIARARGEAFQKRFKPPEGTSGFIGSLVRSVVDWRESKSNLTHEQYIKKEIDITIRPPAPPLPIPQVGEEVETQARRRRPRGRRETFLTGDLVPSEMGKKKVLG